MGHSILTQEHLDVLHRPVFGHLATAMADGSPQVTPVWVDSDDEAILINTTKGKTKHRNLKRDPRVALSVLDTDQPYRALVIRGRAELSEEGAEDHLDRMAQKYLGMSVYPWRRAGDVRVIIRLRPDSVAIVG